MMQSPTFSAYPSANPYYNYNCSTPSMTSHIDSQPHYTTSSHIPSVNDNYYYNNNNSYSCHSFITPDNHSFYPTSSYATNSDGCYMPSYLPNDSAYYSSYQKTPNKPQYSVDEISNMSNQNKKRKFCEEECNEQENGEKYVKRAKVAKLSDELENTRCNECNQTFESWAKCIMHRHRFHFNGKANTCPICSE